MGTLHTKRIAFNTLFLYVRMLILMFVALNTSRVLLRELGFNDFGIYGVVLLMTKEILVWEIVGNYIDMK